MLKCRLEAQKSRNREEEKGALNGQEGVEKGVEIICMNKI